MPVNVESIDVTLTFIQNGNEVEIEKNIDNDKLEWFIKNAYKELNDRDSKYNINDLCLVRTTDILPSNGVIESRANAQAILKMYSPYFKFSDKDIELISYYSYRTTIHFTLNGLVEALYLPL